MIILFFFIKRGCSPTHKMSSSSELSATVLSLIFEFLVLELDQIAAMPCVFGK